MIYRISADAVEARTVESETIEDAVREFNRLNGVVIPFKKLTILEGPAPVSAPEPVVMKAPKSRAAKA